MSKTPERIVKDAIESALREFDIRPAKDAGAFESANGWYFMPGGGAYGVRGIPDYIGHYKGRFFSIEAKKPGTTPKGFQALQVEAIGCSGGANFIIDGDLTEFREWLGD